MASGLNPLNSIAGFSVGETPVTVIYGNGDVTSNHIIASTSANLGLVSNVTITGGSSGQYLQTTGNGVLSWATVASGNGISNGYSNVSIPSPSGNVYINANGGTDQQWIFGTDGQLTLSSDAAITGPANTAINIYTNSGVYSGITLNDNGVTSNVVLYSQEGAYDWSFGSDGLLTAPGSIALNDFIVVNANGSAEGGQLVLGYAGVSGLTGQGNSSWNMDVDSSNNFRVFTQYANSATATAMTIYNANADVELSSNLIVDGNIANANNITVTNNITADSANVTGNITAGNITTTGSAGNISGANVIFANSFTSNGGTVDFNTNGANVQLGNVGNVHILGGSDGFVLQTDGTGNLSWTEAPNINEITNGNSNVTIPSQDGNVVINANSGTDQQWVFDTTGNLTVPGSSYIKPTTGTLNLTDASGNSYIQLDPNNIYLYTNYEGSEYEWHLDTTGNTSFPSAGTANLGNLAIATYFQGDGGLLSNIAGGNVQGNVAFANYAYNVDAANVSGTVANANYAAYAGNAFYVDGANVNGNVGFANYAYNVDGPNVSGTVANANYASYAGNAFYVDGGNVNGNVAFANYAYNVDGANVSGNVAFANYAYNVDGANVNGTVANANYSLYSGTVLTNAQPNITSVGTLSSLVVSGNIQSNSDVIANTVTSVSGTITISSAAGSGANIQLYPDAGGNIDVGSVNINNLADPNAAQDAATKYYVDSVAQGLSPKASVVYATTSGLPAYTYNNGTAGVGATITGNVAGALVIDGQTVASTERVLIKNETGANAPYNGIYVVSNPGNSTASFTLTRSSDFDQGSQIPGAFVFVEDGPVNGSSGWVCTDVAPVTVGTTNITFTQFSGGGTYSAGTGLTLTGTQFSISNTAVTTGSYGGGDQVATFTVNQQGQLTTASNTYITANAANLTGNVLSTSILTSSLTSVGTLGNLSVSGNITAGNANLGNVATANSFSTNGSGGDVTLTGGNVTGANVVFANSFTSNGGVVDFSTNNPNVQLGNVGNVHIGGGSSGQYLQTNGSGTLSWVSVPTATSIANGTSNVNISTANGNVTTSVGGTANVLVVTTTGANILGDASVSGNVILTNPANTAAGTAYLGYASVTTSAVTTDQTIASVNVAGISGNITGAEFLIKGVDAGGSKYQVTSIHAVTDGTDVGWSIFGGVSLGTSVGSFSVNIVGSTLNLAVTPTSSNSTVFTTQYRLI